MERFLWSLLFETRSYYMDSAGVKPLSIDRGLLARLDSRCKPRQKRRAAHKIAVAPSEWKCLNFISAKKRLAMTRASIQSPLAQQASFVAQTIAQYTFLRYTRLVMLSRPMRDCVLVNILR
jgi:hypothetical protein